MSGQTTSSASRKRLVHQLDSPFSTVAWPEISQNDQDIILELLCDFLKPLGYQRMMHTTPSKGKRSIKRRKQGELVDTSNPVRRKPSPKLATGMGVDIGFNSISRNLASSAGSTEKSMQPSDTRKAVSYAMVFVARGNQSSTFNCHFPQMVCAASKNLAHEEKTRLVGFSKPCSAKLSSSLGIARVSSVAIRKNTPAADALWAVVKDTVQPVIIPWLQSFGDTNFKSTCINAMETTVGQKKN